MSDHDRRRRGRHDRQPRRGHNSGGPRPDNRKDREPEPEPPEPAPCTPPRPIILTKPSSEKKTDDSIKSVDNAIIMVKSRDDSKSRPPQSISPSELQNYRLKSLQSPSPVPVLQDGMSPQLRLALPAPMSHPVKVMDENLQWSDAGLEFLLDQTDYFVIGVIGPQGGGKSTVLSLLAGSLSDNECIFKQAPSATVDCSHQTAGVDMYITSNRIIFLDTQPLLSASLLDTSNRSERKFSGEYGSSEHFIEIQSLQLTAFMYTVCNIVLVVQDWFTDPYFLKSLMTAEMLRPSIPSVGTEGQHSLEQEDFTPHVVLIQNKCQRSDFTTDSMEYMTKAIAKCFEKSKLRYQGGVSMAAGNLLPNLTSKTIPNGVNLFLLPIMDEDVTDRDPVSVLLPEYRGHPGFEELLRVLRNQLYQLPRQQFTNTSLTERNWFHFAARMWESVKKSQLFADYSRLLP